MGLLRRLFGPPAPRLSHLANQLADLEARLDYLEDAQRKLRGLVTGRLRRARPIEVEEVPEKSLEDAPGRTIGDGQGIHYPPTSARRFPLRGW